MGQFGRLAWQRLSAQEPEAEFCLVDHDAQRFGFIPSNPTIRLVTASVAVFLTDALEAKTLPDWIIPAIPRHVAFDWLWGQRSAGEIWRQIPVPMEMGQDLPFVLSGPAGELYLSLSTERCPDDCPEPAMSCSLTGTPRTYNLYEYLENSVLGDYTSLVIRSRQLAPGVGGYRPADLHQLRRQVLGLEGKILISTACRCHGVTNGLERLKGMEAGGGI